MKHNAASRFHGTLGAVAVSHSLFFVLVETWMAVRGEFSVTVANDTLQATLTALFVYGAAAFLAGECLAVAYGMVRRDAPKDSMVALPAGTAASLAVWTLIMVYASDRPLTVFATGYAALAGSGVLGWALARRQPAAAKQLMCILGTACLYGIAALNLGDRAFFARSARADWAMALCLGWALGIGLGGALLWLFVARAGLRRVLAAVGLAAAAAPLALGYLVVHGLLPRGEPNQPSLLVVSADTLRADYCSAYGGPVPTPALEALAAQGVFFERFYALAPWTMPSLNAMFSSRYPPGFLPDSDLDLGDPLRYAAIGSYWCGDGDATFPERAARHGLVCGAVVANPLMDQPWLMDGFREAAVFNPHGAESVGPFSRLPLLRGVAAWFAPSLVPRQPYDLTRLTLEYALQFLERYHSQPFFLWVHFLDPHAPYEPPQRFTDESDRESVHDLMIRLQKYA
ncbi:MAG: sulfatase-like hydrolase/transferase, partial [Candidatus Hydrogenedentes bacterium]|nr:sulfatase-like hydrolase/transferase [Candidatus Hydrogenedentota bacterium]